MKVTSVPFVPVLGWWGQDSAISVCPPPPQQWWAARGQTTNATGHCRGPPGPGPPELATPLGVDCLV